MFGEYITLRLRWFIRHNRGLLLTFLVVGVGMALVGSYLFRGGLPLPERTELSTQPHEASSYNKVEEVFLRGEYEHALALLEEALRKNPDDKALNELQSLLNERLSLNVKFHYFLERKNYKTTTSISPSIVLTSRDPYYLTITPSRTCYLYLFQVDSSGKIEALYPNRRYSSGGNPVPPGRLRIPDGFRWLRLDEIRGMETVYLIATRLENKRLEDLSRRISSDKRPEIIAQLTQELISYLRALESIAHSVPGVVVKVYQFTHG